MSKKKISFHNFVTLNSSEIEKVFIMRNSDYVRKFCDNAEKISFEEHLNFISSLKINSSKKYYLIKIDGTACGVYNLFDINKESSSAKTGIYVLEEFSRYSFDIGVLSINILDKNHIETLHSSVHKDNLKALLFNIMKLGAKIIKETENEYIFKYTFNRNTLKRMNEEFDFELIDG